MKWAVIIFIALGILASLFFYGVHLGGELQKKEYLEKANKMIEANNSNIIKEANIENSRIFHYRSCSE